jgi:hypothetical protein
VRRGSTSICRSLEILHAPDLMHRNIWLNAPIGCDDSSPMSEKPESEQSVLGALPHSRSHRRSDKRAARPAADPPPPPEAELPHDDVHERSDDGAEAFELLRTTVQAVGELAEIGMTLGARLLRSAISRLPHP